MNATEQRQHTRRTDELGKQITGLEESMTQALLALEGFVGQALSKETQHRNSLADQQRTYVDTALVALRDRVALEKGQLEDTVVKFQGMTFWPRLRWLLTGKL